MSSAYTAKVRRDVDARDAGVCRRCGVAGGQISRHHRKPRGMGGANRSDAGRLSNIVTLCGTGTTGCHGWVEANRAQALREGWLVSSWHDPADVPICGHDGPLWLLDNGSITYRQPSHHPVATAGHVADLRGGDAP